MSFLLDPFLLVLCGAVIVWLRNRWLYRLSGHASKILGGVAILLFWIVAGSLYLNFGWFDWIWQWTGRAVNGRDFMINSCVFQFEYLSTAGLIDFIALFLFLLYPLWLYLGILLGYLLFGQHERQTGMVGLL
ncbi:MAG: hypothetical protein ACFE8O_04790 [Candidatus Hermodarchaeota archaeon]